MEKNQAQNRIAEKQLSTPASPGKKNVSPQKKRHTTPGKSATGGLFFFWAFGLYWPTSQ